MKLNFMNRINWLSIAMGIVVTGCIAVLPASADVLRYQMQTVTLTVPVNYLGVDYTHNYTLILNPCDGTLVGTGTPGVNDQGETTFGSLSGNSLTYTSTYIGPLPAGWSSSYVYTAIIDITTGLGTWSDNGGAPGGTESGTITGAADTVVDLTHYRNHGDFVSHSPDKNDAAHSCIGMPIQSRP